MYDSQTAGLIRAAPPVADSELDTLPQRMTRAYAQITALRVRLSEGGPAVFEALRNEFHALRHLAHAYEVYSATLPAAPDRAAAAFVAASAHQLLYRAAKLSEAKPGAFGRLSRSSISPDLSATLLFLGAGYPSDAWEIAPRVADATGTALEHALVIALGQLARGELGQVLRQEIPDTLVSHDVDDDATQRLWFRLLRGVRELARALLGEDGGSSDPANVALAEFERVRDLAVQRFGADAFPEAVRGLVPPVFFNTFAGPRHLAMLLVPAAERLLRESVARIPAPAGVNPEAWRHTARQIAARRPYLWANHVDAVEQGYLDVGVSSVATFPTGAGKSTLAQLKIAATLDAGRNVVFLAPTLALVSQVRRELAALFPSVEVKEVLTESGAYEETLPLGQPEVAVMTPERCLTLLGTASAPSQGLGLVVFDECHLLHATGRERDRRSIDAMLCLLGLLETGPGADVLLMSAMVSNAGDLAGWIGEVTGRRCVPLSQEWKPTRQVRGCVVYERGRLDDIRVEARRAALAPKPATRATRNKPDLAVRPYALLGLTHTWQPVITDRDYALVGLSDEQVTLATSQAGAITANKNKVAALLAARMAAAGMKVLVFVQEKPACASIAKTAADHLAALNHPPADLTLTERALLDAATEDVGEERLVCGPIAGLAAFHHGHLLPAEREISESIFARSDGVKVLVATPTLAQGMNLPADVVIIAGDGRYEEESGARAPMHAHEILNAAGRAGRAGHAAAGLVLVIPEDVVTATPDLAHVDGGWRALYQNIFSRRDQCLQVMDPLGSLLDSVVARTDPLRSRPIRYFLTRLPLAEGDGREADAAPRLLNRSLAAYHARRENRTESFQQRIQSALVRRRELLEIPDQVLWLDQLATTLGFTSAQIKHLNERLLAEEIPSDATTSDCLSWLFSWMSSLPSAFDDLLEVYQVVAAL